MNPTGHRPDDVLDQRLFDPARSPGLGVEQLHKWGLPTHQHRAALCSPGRASSRAAPATALPAKSHRIELLCCGHTLLYEVDAARPTHPCRSPAQLGPRRRRVRAQTT
ncbi:hypothetical protein ACRAWF_24430 [Streptomyces sp. L7]